ncbi:MAG: hypothetical protein E6K17_05290 [Methanobacteriota archaeon]|nr:MAG: hypothetical protein E6K17_05290 [Euryarchaeota archaeon]
MEAPLSGSSERDVLAALGPDTPLITIEHRFDRSYRLVLLGAALSLTIVSALLLWEALSVRSINEIARSFLFAIGVIGIPLSLGMSSFILLARRSPVVITPTGLTLSRLYLVFSRRKLQRYGFEQLAQVFLLKKDGDEVVAVMTTDGRLVSFRTEKPQAIVDILLRLKSERLGAAANFAPESKHQPTAE